MPASRSTSPSGDLELIAAERLETGLQCSAYLSRKSEETQEANVKTEHNEPSTALLPVAITAIIAAIGIAGMAYVFVAADRAPEGGVGMQSTSAVFRAGATITPTRPAPGSVPAPIPITVADEARQGL
jgi:hypothetical protein